MSARSCICKKNNWRHPKNEGNQTDQSCGKKRKIAKMSDFAALQPKNPAEPAIKAITGKMFY